MLRPRGVVRTARTIVVCLIAVLVCPALGEITALASPGAVSCASAHACCRAHTNGACPHQMPAAGHDQHCRGAVCVVTCADHRGDATLPVVLIGFSSLPAQHGPSLRGARLSAISNQTAASVVRLPITPPPRTLTAA